MSECPDCGMRDDDWFLCRRDKCAIKASEAAAAYGKGLESQIARLQEQVETLRKERDEAIARADRQKAAGHCDAYSLTDDQPIKCGWQHRAEAAEAERDRLREALEPFRRVLAVTDALPAEFKPSDDIPLREVMPGAWPSIGELRGVLAALQKEPQP